MLVDSSGLKLGGPGEWRSTAPASGAPLHIGFDAVTGRIVASILTDRDVDDASQVEPLLDQIAEPVELFMGDGGYDRTNVYTALDERHPDAKVIVPPRSDAVLSATADTPSAIASPLPARHIAIVDDVITTGSTANELARILKRAGAKRVEVWAVARAGSNA